MVKVGKDRLMVHFVHLFNKNLWPSINGVGGFVDVHLDIDSDVQNITEGNLVVKVNLNEEYNDQEDGESIHTIPKENQMIGGCLMMIGNHNFW